MNTIEGFARYLAENQIEAGRDRPLSEWSSFRIGGPADLFIAPKSEEEAAKALCYAGAHGIPLVVLGKGSNVLFSDAGYRGAVLHLGAGFDNIRRVGENEIYCEAGAGLGDLAVFAAECGLTGLEFAYGIPGSVGGGVYMNAGAFGSEVKNVIVSARYLSADGVRKELGVDEMNLSYRHSAFMEMDGVITGAAFKLAQGDPEEIKARMGDYLGRRESKQPLEYPSAGSTFKRPAGNFASALIDQCGLKGLAVGGAAVSEKHAGFVINTGDASCRDVLALIGKVKEEVFRQTGYRLEPEVRVIGE
ncbi:MAG: UDP-N-acetylmuramate dehydrogenase [Oscillospiraceae bacterium]|nr:UDP-N-acetylmuramate dehydrogenase [Oscillospiraceae bacterium]